MHPDAIRWIDRLGLAPHPEGGHFREVYRSAGRIPAGALADTHGGERSMATSIYFLLDGSERSHLHRLRSDEIWFHHAGGPMLVSMILPDGSRKDVPLGTDRDGAIPQVVIPAGTWFGACPVDPSQYALVGCVVAPGFDFADFELGRRAELMDRYPRHAELIEELALP